MKNTWWCFFTTTISLLVLSCSTEISPQSKKDSIVSPPAPELLEIQTDSGKLVVKISKGFDEGKATLYDREGRVRQKGLYLDHEVAGAWIRYDSSGNVIGAEHYSHGKPLMQLDKTDFDFSRRIISSMGISLLIPKTWNEVPPGGSSQFVTFLKQRAKVASNQVSPNILITKSKLEAGENLELLFNRQLEFMHKNYNRVDIIEERSDALDSCPSFQRYGFHDSGEERTGFFDVILLQGENIWHFDCEAPNAASSAFLKYQGVFEEIIGSIHFVN